MRDFFDWVSWGLPSMGIDVDQLEKQVERENRQSSGESVGVSSLIAGLNATLGNASYTGTVSQLWNKIRCVTPHFAFMNPRALSIAIKREHKELAAVGWRLVWINDKPGEGARIR